MIKNFSRNTLNRTESPKFEGNMHVDQIKNEEQLVEALQPLDVSPLWAQMKRLNPPNPSPKTVPFVWDYETIKPYLEKAGQVVTEQQAERRVLMLVNPTRGNVPVYLILIINLPLKMVPHRYSITRPFVQG
jgi:gentisate 1,2-dioxygenase